MEGLSYRSIADYTKAKEQASAQPEVFWENIANQFEWYEKWDKVLDYDFHNPEIKWFLGGKLNITENPEELVIETINEIRKMTFGSSEFNSFIEKYFSKCIDISKIVNDCIAIEIYDPVCGCNGFTYTNSGYASCNGISDYKKGPCN